MPACDVPPKPLSTLLPAEAISEDAPAAAGTLGTGRGAAFRQPLDAGTSRSIPISIRWGPAR